MLCECELYIIRFSVTNDQLLAGAQQWFQIMKFCLSLNHLFSRLIRRRNHKETHHQVNLNSVYKHYKTLCWFPPGITLYPDCSASNQLGMIIFAPVPLRCPTSWSSNGCQVLFGLERIKLSPPCCVLIYCFRHFHIWFIFTARWSWASQRPEPSAASTAKWLQSGDTVPASSGERHSSQTSSSSGNKKRDCNRIPVLDIFP